LLPKASVLGFFFFLPWLQWYKKAEFGCLPIMLPSVKIIIETGIWAVNHHINQKALENVASFLAQPRFLLCNVLS
jgi:uncharacterized protein YjfI (DUF2170 family)